MARCTRYIEGLSLTIRLYRLPYHISHRIRRFPHHVRRGVGVGAESEARAVMSQGAGQGLHIHPVLQRERGEGMPEIVEPDMLSTDGFQDLLVGMPKARPCFLGMENPEEKFPPL